MNTDVKTRVTPLDELQVPSPQGQDCLVTIYSSDARLFGKRHVLHEEAITLGRGSENNIVLENDSVSRSHARIEKRKQHWYVIDLDSTNGTFVNDVPISEHRLRRGDQVKIG
ncbi:MAG: FHA domain-containing protein, partial [Polyangiales bacterium]